ncbi:hypothetical protein PCYB_005730 [Plasmodium cynomolgi strain B]|uniref:CYIR protein n=1 Tax=Plasmodium cynomolgi (strain B) TaxID=1120755 RepID=K6V0G8_PLACD|nr:hypothetical protein PCYB_005730 [Plasmodium cynomolgi strain B]GAB69824.1 hypothetical protein PCYB_005730 [Plasmodium cynomolgi strain B]
MNRKLVSSVELKNLPDIKNEAQVERMGNKPREFSNKLEDSRTLYCIYLIVANSTRAPYSWITCGIAIPAFMGFVLLSVFLGTYYPKKRIKNIK